MKGKLRVVIGLLCCMVSTVFFVSPRILADSFTGTSYKIDASVMNSFGGDGTSTSYAMTSSGGESIIGQGLGGSYLLSEGYTSQLNKSLQMTIQPYGLVEFLNMDEGQGPTAYDWSTNDNNATNTTGNDLSWTTGKKNNAYDQSLTTGHLQTSTAPITSSSTFTYEGWFNPNATTSGMVLFGQDDNTGTGDKWKVVTNASGSVTFTLQKSGVSTSAVGSTALSTGVWQHILVAYDGTTMKLFLNGVLIAQQANTNGVHNFSLPLSIGDYNSPAVSSSFNGKIDEIKAYSRAFSDTEALNDYTAYIFVDPAYVTIPAVTPGASSQVASSVVVQTDAPGYNLSFRQFTNLSGAATTIPGITTGTIATPALWVEGTTKGEGFTLTSAPSLDPKWGTTPNYQYAAIPSSDTTFYSRSGGYTGGTKDVVAMQYRIDVNSSQVAASYKHTVVFTGTMIP